MAENLRTEWVGIDARQQLVEWNHGLVKEVKILRQHVANMYQAWMVGKAPIPPPHGFLDDVITRTLASPDHPSSSVILPPSSERLSALSDVRLLERIKVPKFEECKDLVVHLREYCKEMGNVGEKDDLLMAYFSKSLTGAALEWYDRQDVSNWHAWDDMAQDFLRHFQNNVDIVPNHSSISQIEENPEEGFGKFWLRLSEQVARGDLPMKRKDVKMPHQCQSPVVALAKRPQSQPHPRGYPSAPYDHPQHYFSLWESQRYASFAKYPAPQNAYPPPQEYRKPPGSGFRPNQAFRNERLLKRENALTPIGQPYESMFERLKHSGIIEPLTGCTPYPCARSFNPIARCAYHSNFQGHSTEDCRSLKKEIERMIQEGVIVINDSGREHGNPLRYVLTKAEDVETDSGLGNIDVKLSG